MGAYWYALYTRCTPGAPLWSGEQLCEVLNSALKEADAMVGGEQGVCEVLGEPTIVASRAAQKHTYGFVTTVGVNDALHVLVKEGLHEGLLLDGKLPEGVPSFEGGVPLIKLNIQKERDPNYHSVGAKLLGVDGCGAEGISKWVENVMADFYQGRDIPYGGLMCKVDKEDYKKFGKTVHSVYFKQKQVMLDFQFAAHTTTIDIKDADDRMVEGWEVAIPMPSMSEQQAQDKQERKMYMKGISYQVQPREFFVCMMKQNDGALRKHCEEGWLMRDSDGRSRGFGFLVAKSAQDRGSMLSLMFKQPNKTVFRMEPAKAPLGGSGKGGGRDNLSGFGSGGFGGSGFTGGGFSSGGFASGLPLTMAALEQKYPHITDPEHTKKGVRSVLMEEFTHLASPAHVKESVASALHDEQDYLVGVSEEGARRAVSELQRYTSETALVLNRIADVMKASYGVDVTDRSIIGKKRNREAEEQVQKEVIAALEAAKASAARHGSGSSNIMPPHLSSTDPPIQETALFLNQLATTPAGEAAIRAVLKHRVEQMHV